MSHAVCLGFALNMSHELVNYNFLTVIVPICWECLWHLEPSAAAAFYVQLTSTVPRQVSDGVTMSSTLPSCVSCACTDASSSWCNSAGNSTKHDYYSWMWHGCGWNMKWLCLRYAGIWDEDKCIYPTRDIQACLEHSAILCAYCQISLLLSIS